MCVYSDHLQDPKTARRIYRISLGHSRVSVSGVGLWWGVERYFGGEKLFGILSLLQKKKRKIVNSELHGESCNIILFFVSADI